MTAAVASCAGERGSLNLHTWNIPARAPGDPCRWKESIAACARATVNRMDRWRQAPTA